MNRIAIVSAMAEELRGLQAHLDRHRTVARAGREFHVGRLAGRDAVLVLSRIGKVDFNRFIAEVASHYTAAVVRTLVARLPG